MITTQQARARFPLAIFHPLQGLPAHATFHVALMPSVLLPGESDVVVQTSGARHVLFDFAGPLGADASAFIRQHVPVTMSGGETFSLSALVQLCRAHLGEHVATELTAYMVDYLVGDAPSLPGATRPDRVWPLFERLVLSGAPEHDCARNVAFRLISGEPLGTALMPLTAPLAAAFLQDLAGEWAWRAAVGGFSPSAPVL